MKRVVVKSRWKEWSTLVDQPVWFKISTIHSWSNTHTECIIIIVLEHLFGTYFVWEWKSCPVLCQICVLYCVLHVWKCFRCLEGLPRELETFIEDGAINLWPLCIFSSYSNSMHLGTSCRGNNHRIYGFGLDGPLGLIHQGFSYVFLVYQSIYTGWHKFSTVSDLFLRKPEISYNYYWTTALSLKPVPKRFRQVWITGIYRLMLVACYSCR